MIQKLKLDSDQRCRTRATTSFATRSGGLVMTVDTFVPIAAAAMFLVFMVGLGGTALYVRLGEQRK